MTLEIARPETEVRIQRYSRAVSSTTSTSSSRKRSTRCRNPTRPSRHRPTRLCTNFA